jgi:Tfp pilus assembly protein FimT
MIELLMAITVFGMSALLTLPLLKDLTLAQDVRSARAAVANTYARARVHAVQMRKPATLQVSATSIWVTVPRGGGVDTVGPVVNLEQAYGVAVEATGGLTVLPTGLVNASVPVVIRVRRAGLADSVVISGYGRLR